jgi:hypothetical protein
MVIVKAAMLQMQALWSPVPEHYRPWQYSHSGQATVSQNVPQRHGTTRHRTSYREPPYHCDARSFQRPDIN